MLSSKYSWKEMFFTQTISGTGECPGGPWSSGSPQFSLLDIHFPGSSSAPKPAVLPVHQHHSSSSQRNYYLLILANLFHLRAFTDVISAKICLESQAQLWNSWSPLKSAKIRLKVGRKNISLFYSPPGLEILKFQMFYTKHKYLNCSYFFRNLTRN